MTTSPPPSGEPPRRDSFKVFLPGGVPVLRAAVEELLRSGWDELFRQRAWEISCAFEGSFRASGHEDLAKIARSLTMLFEIDQRESVMLGRHLDRKLNELLGKLEARLDADGEVRTG
jgi:hypothetical protein